MLDLGLGSWQCVLDGDPYLVALYERHYSANPRTSRARRLKHGVSGVGESQCLLTVRCDAGFIWVRNTRERMDRQIGVQCTFFRNEGRTRSSDLIREADAIAWTEWPSERLWTYVDPKQVRSSNPGYSFIKAGWTRLEERSKGGLVILEHWPLGAGPRRLGGAG